MTVVFLIGLVTLIALPWSMLVSARAKNDLETAWYGLVVVGIAAAVVAYGVQLGALTAWISIAEPSLEDVTRLDFLLIAHVLLGLLLEGCKVEGVRLFQTRLTRGDWVLYGVAAGAGSGLLQAIWLAGAVALFALLGGGAIEQKHLWLLVRCGALIAMEAALTGVAMYLVARGVRRVSAIAAAGAAHGLVRLAAAVLILSPTMVFFGQAAAYGVAAAVAGGLLVWRIRTVGWPT